MLRLVALTLVLPFATEAIFFGGGGGGCGCQQQVCPPPPPPCLPQPCLPQLPPIQIPSICLPPLPRLQLPCPSLPTCGGCGGGCCGRKKRSVPVISRHHEESNANLCNDPQIRKVILTNITEDPVASKIAIHSELKAKLHGNYVVMCSSRAFSFVADTSAYCVEGTETNTCYVFSV